jgi:hypothetical protein
MGNDANIYNSLNGQRIVGNENSVIVSSMWNEMEAFPLAKQHCKKYGRSTRFRSVTCAKAAFDCVLRSPPRLEPPAMTLRSAIALDLGLALACGPARAMDRQEANAKIAWCVELHRQTQAPAGLQTRAEARRGEEQRTHAGARVHTGRRHGHQTRQRGDVARAAVLLA